MTIEQMKARRAKLMDKRDKLMAKVDASEDVNEVRAISEQLSEISEFVRDIDEDIRAMESEGEKRGFNPLATYGVQGASVEKREDEDITNSMEYRSAFMEFVTKKKPIPAELRQDANTLTTDVSSVIPTILVNRIIEGLTVCGMILPLVTRTNYAGGVVVPTSSVKPVATWVAEGASSDKQKKTTSSVTFAWYKLRCEISMSMEVGVMAISAFETAFVANVVDAMTVAIEKAILAGTGSGQPTGILTQSVPAGHNIAIADKVKNIPTYAELVAAEAAVPVEYENTAKWFMTKAQFMKFVAMTDEAGQPIARVNYGIDGKPERILLGREVVVHPYATEMGSYVAAIYDFRDYVLNTIYDLGIERKRDWDTEDLLTKAVMSVDGKPVDNSSLVVMTVSA